MLTTLQTNVNIIAQNVNKCQQIVNNICKSRHEPIGVRDFRGFGTFLKDFGPSSENQRGKAHVRCSLFPHIAIIFRNAPNIKYPSPLPGPYPESLTRNKRHRMEALYGVVPYKASCVYGEPTSALTWADEKRRLGSRVRHNPIQGFHTMTLVAGKTFWIGAWY